MILRKTTCTIKEQFKGEAMQQIYLQLTALYIENPLNHWEQLSSVLNWHSLPGISRSFPEWALPLQKKVPLTVPADWP